MSKASRRLARPGVIHRLRLPANVIAAIREEEEASAAARKMDAGERQAARQQFASIIGSIKVK